MATTVRFIPAGSRIVGVKSGKAPAWEELKREVILTADEYAHIECPITHESVNRIAGQGYELYFPDRIVRVRLEVSAGDLDDAKLARFKPVFLSYDIPQDAMDYTVTPPRAFQNPSKYLRTFAIRVNKSDWLMDAGDFPNALYGRMMDAGATPRRVRLHPEDGRQHVLEAILALQDEIVKRTVSAAQSQLDADVQLANSDTEENMTPEKAEKRYRARSKSIAKELKSLSDDLSKALVRFGISADVLKVDRLASTGDAIRTAMEKRAEAFKQCIEALKAIGNTDTTTLANLAANDQVPVEVMAGALEDAGDDAGAATLMAAFAEPKDIQDDSTFSLSDAVDDAA